jgi:ATP-dependent exoDNAse (exonuclease V) alpha subunit
MKKGHWTQGQRECMSEFKKWNRKGNKQTFEYEGPAGTGKTSIAREMIKSIGLEPREVLAMTFTGRAASNLTLKGIPAVSIHSGLLDYIRIPKKDVHGDIIYKNGRALTSWTFEKKIFLPKSIKMLFIDEGGFINEEMGELIESFDLPVCVAGDMAQLGPIFGKSYFLQKPDFSLWEITRQAQNSGIIELATRIRLGQELPTTKYRFKDDCFVLPKRKITDTVLLNSDIILCGKNTTRNYFNSRIREDLLGITSRLPVRGDKLVCRHNYWNRELGGVALTNGILGYVIHGVDRGHYDVKTRTVKVDFQPDYIAHDYYAALPIDIDFFQAPCGPNKGFDQYNPGVKLELGSAITTHMAQGSEFPSVLYWDEPSPFASEDEIRKHRYTGATRAVDLLTFTI